MQISDSTKHYFWGAVGGMLALAMVTYSYKIMLTPAEAERLGKQRADLAVAQALAPFCVEKFRSAKGAAGSLAELQKLDEYERATYIEKGGWATMPAGTPANSGVASACAQVLTKG